MKLAALFSGGKDSTYALWLEKHKGHEISCLITFEPERKDSYMFHVPNVDLTVKQAELMGIPQIYCKSSGVKELELDDIKDALIAAKLQFGIEGVVSGAFASNYQKERVDRICKELGLESLAPLWHIDAEKYIESLIKDGFKVIFVGIAAEGLTEKWLGRELDSSALKELMKLNAKHGVSVAGEGGEFESFVYDCPLFSKPIEIVKTEKVMEKENAGILKILKAK